MTFNGHYCCERQLVQYNDAGFPVLHVQVNYSVDFGDNITADAGWIRLVELDEAAGEIRLRSFKPAVPLFDFEQENPLPESVTSYAMSWRGRYADQAHRFRQGDAGYTGTRDRWFGSLPDNNTTPPDQPYLRTGYGQANPARQQALLKFEGAITHATIPPGSTVAAATLTLVPATDQEFSDGAANEVYEMLTPWTEGSATYGAAAWSGGASGGVDTDGLEANMTPVSDSAAFADGGYGDGNPLVIDSGRTLHYDVTDTVRNWALGAENNGFLLESIPGPDNALFVASSEYAGSNAGARPMLNVSYSSARKLQFQQGRTGYGSATDTWIDSTNPTSAHGSDISLHCTSQSAQEQVLIRFGELVGSGAQQLPHGAEITSARLVLHSNRQQYAGSTATHALHEMRIGWTTEDSYSSATWNADGIQADDAEADSIPVATTPVGMSDDARVAFDVTQSVQSWVDGETNNGWVLLQPSGNDRWFIASSDDPRASMRPRLLVEFVE